MIALIGSDFQTLMKDFEVLLEKKGETFSVHEKEVERVSASTIVDFSVRSPHTLELMKKRLYLLDSAVRYVFISSYCVIFPDKFKDMKYLYSKIFGEQEVSKLKNYAVLRFPVVSDFERTENGFCVGKEIVLNKIYELTQYSDSGFYTL